MNIALYKKEVKSSFKLLLIFGAVLTMYISMIIGMYDPATANVIRQFEQLMPELMSAVGMSGDTDTLGSFLCSYLYGMIMLIFPMIYSIIRANGLVAKYVDQGSMASLLAAPVKRRCIIITQILTLVTGIVLLLLYCTALELSVAEATFPGELVLAELVRLNGGLLCLELFIGSFCILCSCIFSESRYSIAVGAGIPVIMYVLQMLANMGGKLENIKYITFFTLFDAQGLIQSEQSAFVDAAVLSVFAVVFCIAAVFIFCKKDLHL